MLNNACIQNVRASHGYHTSIYIYIKGGVHHFSIDVGCLWSTHAYTFCQSIFI